VADLKNVPGIARELSLQGAILEGGADDHQGQVGYPD
jgi:hypothetical protein